MGKDSRIPVLFGQAPQAGDAVLVEQGLPIPEGAYVLLFTSAPSGHVPGCLCCAGRSSAAAALMQIFRDRAVGAAPFFSRLVVWATVAGMAEVTRALAEDVLARARYRLA